MSVTLLIVCAVVAWVVVAMALALLIGRGVRAADRHEHGSDREPRRRARTSIERH